MPCGCVHRYDEGANSAVLPGAAVALERAVPAYLGMGRVVRRNLNNINLMHFAAFRAVMLTGTVSGAAEIIGRSQSAVSRMLDRLEHDMGIRLFERRKGLVAPLPDAHLLLAEVERAHLALEALGNAGERLADRPDRRLDLAVMPTMGTNLLPAVLGTFARRRPGVSVTLNIRMSSQIEEEAVAGRIDLGLAERPLRRSGYHSEVFSDAPYVAMVPRGHPLADRTTLTPEDLCAVPCIGWSRVVAARTLVDQALRGQGIDATHGHETSLSDTAVGMVRQGLGIALIDPFSAIRHADESLRLIPFLPRIPFNVALLRPENRTRNPSVELLLNIMKAERDTMLARLPQP